jgi:DNA-directed RNA polymerase subunit RPC12/RpoP
MPIFVPCGNCAKDVQTEGHRVNGRTELQCRHCGHRFSMADADIKERYPDAEYLKGVWITSGRRSR